MRFIPALAYDLYPDRKTLLIQFIRLHNCWVTSVIEQSAMGTYHPVFHFPTVHKQRRSSFTMWKRGDRRWRTQKQIPLIEELLPGDNRLVTPVKRFKVLVEGDWRFILFRLECSNNHSN